MDELHYAGIVPAKIALRVKLTRFRSGHDANIGKVGLLQPLELSVNGDIIVGLFYPNGPTGGYGQVIWPTFESA